VIRGAARLRPHSHAARGNERLVGGNEMLVRRREIIMIHQAPIDVQIPFHAVDMMEAVWHGHYVKYLESVICATFLSFPRAAWERSPGALRPEARRI